MSTTAPSPSPTASDPGTDAPGGVETRTDTATDSPVTLTEAVTTSVTGMLIGGAALWFRAPICFSC